ncbi:putative carbohydrate-binding module family 13 protein [Diaporthe ampelina]|uniref:Putative carbohydrate-binding module family 13 protein n=1 Tax=Diaporthe ampelina TaxID=1214573 RepID=A0A0G2HMW1_9PEZI|nr:putative carbohydrate-binding module family 13 protein [Diaporthe ampelina]
MAAQATGVFDPNEYYRFTNLALGGEFSLDVDASKDYPDGKLGMAPSGLYTGQIYQILENADDPGHYWFASSWLGAKKKMDAVINSKGDYAPFLRNITTDYNQTWGLTPHNDVANNRTTWTIMPDWFGGVGTSLAMSVYNDTKQPFLATPGPNPDLGNGDVNQAWFITKEGLTIDDPTFSSTNLPALATAVRSLQSKPTGS